jgi:hypothetical protein
LKHLAFLLLFFASLSGVAEEQFQFSGFGTLGLVQVDSERYGFRSDISYDDGTFKNELDFRTTSILGIQPEYRFNEQFDFVTQFIYRNQNEYTLDTLTRMAFLRYSPQADFSLRLGRTTIDIFHLSEYTDVGFAHPWAKVPTEVYGLISYRHLDGLDATKSFQLDSSTLRAKIFTGESTGDQSGYLLSDELGLDGLWGLSLEWEANGWSLKGNYTVARMKNDIPSTRELANTVAQFNPDIWPNNLAFAEELTLENKKVNYASVSGKVYLADWTLISELSHMEGNGIFLRPIYTGYTSLIYNYNKHAFYLNYSFSRTKNYTFDQDVDPSAFGELIPAIVLAGNYLSSNQKTISVGWRWDITEKLALKAQWERTDIEAQGTGLWLNKDITQTPSEVVNAFYLNMSFIF